MPNIYDESKYDIQYIAGDMDEGIHKTVTIQAQGHPQILWRDKLIIGDLYISGDEMKLHIICPVCLHGLTISNKNKDMEWDGKYISIEPFGCTWELDTNIPTGVFTVSNLCKWRVGVSRGVARDA